MRVVLDNGTSVDLGETEATPTISITDFSRRVTDDYGVTTVVERDFSRRLSVKLALPFENVSAVQQRLADLRATSALWVANERLEWLSVRGFYKDFDLDHAVPPLSYCTLTIEGLAETTTAADDGSDPAPIGATSTLRLVTPFEINDANFINSSVPENDYPEWSMAGSYAVGARVIKASTHRVYESTTSPNIGSDPAGTSGTWLDVGATNRWAMFDQALGSATTAANTILAKVNVASVNAVALLDVSGATVRVQAPGYDRTADVSAGAITFLDLPDTTGRLLITITGPDQVSVGTLLVGRLLDLGITESSPTAGITDYSRKVVDDFGDVTVVERAWSKRMAAKALIRTDAIDVVANRIAAVRARPSLWIGQRGIDSLTVYGFFKDFSIEVGRHVSKLSLSIEGLSKAAPLAPIVPGNVVAWPDVTDPNGTKPADNATNGADPTSPLGSTTVGDFEKQLAAARKQLAYIDETTIPTINGAVAAAGVRIDGAQKDLADTRADVATKIAAANGAISAAQTDLDAARDNLDAEIARAKGAEEDLNQRVDSIAAGGDYDDSSVRALIQTVDTARADGDRAIGQRIDLVQTDYKGLDATTNTRITEKVTALSSADQALGERIDTVTADYKGRDTNVNARVTDAITTLVNTDTALGQQINNVTADYQSRDANVNARVTDAITTLVNTDAALGQQINNVTADYQSRDAAVNARVGQEVLSLTNADTAIGQRIDSVVTDYKTGDNAANGRIDQVAITASDAKKSVADLSTNVNTSFQGVNSALSSYDQRISALSTDAQGYAGRTSLLETRIGNTGSYATSNANFAAWPDGAATPSQWRVWTSGTFTREGSQFQTGAYMVGQVVPDGNDGGILTDVFVTKGYWVIEASVWCSAGTYQGAGVYLGNVPELNFSTTADNEGLIGIGGPGIRNWSFLVKSDFVGQVGFYAMGNWSGFGATTAKTIHWLKCGARPATDGEIKAQKASVDLPQVSARVKQTEDTLADLPNRYAAAQRTAALEAQVNGDGDSRLLARANSNATAIADAKVGAVVGSVTTLSAQVLNRKGNLLPNGSGEGGINNGKPGSWNAGGGVWGNYTSPVWGPVLVVNNTNAPVISVDSPIIPCSGSAWYTASADLLIFSDAPDPFCYVDTVFILASGAYVYSNNGRVMHGQRDFGNPGTRDASWVTALAPADAVSMFMRGVFARADGGTHRVLGIREAKIEQGQGPYSPYSQEATIQSAGAQLTVAMGALAGIDGRTSVYWSVTGTTPDGSTKIQLSKADGSPGLFYIGANLLVDGNAIFNGSVTIKALDRSTMTATTSGSVSGSYGGAGQPTQYIPNLGADMFIRSGGSIYITFTGNIGGTTNGTRDTQPTVDLVNAANNSLLSSVPLPEVGFGNTGRLDNYTIRILNVWGDVTIRWRVAVRLSSDGRFWSNITNPALSVYWTAL